MEDRDFAVLSYSIGEAEIMWLRRTLHFEVLRAVKGVFYEAYRRIERPMAGIILGNIEVCPFGSL